MKYKTLILVALLCASNFLSSAERPLTGCWFPKDIMTWEATTDANAAFNRSYVPLMERIPLSEFQTTNPEQHREGQVCVCSILYPHCGSSPSQGNEAFVGYSPCFWQYIDKMVYWGGSAGEGIICPPPAYAIDAAHRNGVKIMGCIFFPPEYYGGRPEWVDEMLTIGADGRYLCAVKLVDIAQWHGFDGWFINLETYRGSTDQWAAFVNDFMDEADARGLADMELQWYDARRQPKEEILAIHPNVSQFLEYGAFTDHNESATRIGCTLEEKFSKYYCGVECAMSGLTNIREELDLALPRGGHVDSIDLFCPEDHTWRDFVRDILDNPEAEPQRAHEAQKKVFDTERVFWVNEEGNPSRYGLEWRGISGCIAERSVVGNGDFHSYMCNGLGRHRFIRGKKVATGDWWNPGLQQVLPTWRWIMDEAPGLSIEENWDDAWMLGSSYRIFGNIDEGSHLIPLYSANRNLRDETMELVYKCNNGKINLVVGIDDGSRIVNTSLLPVRVSEENGWTIAVYEMNGDEGEASAGQKIRMLGIDLQPQNPDDRYEVFIGGIALYQDKEKATDRKVQNLKVWRGDDDLRIIWDFDGTPDHFDIWLESDGARKLVGQTRGHAWYVAPQLTPASSFEVTVEPVFFDQTVPRRALF